MRFLRSFGQFWYDFVIGDDPKIAIAVVVALAILGAAMTGRLFGDHGLTILGGILTVAAFTISLAIDVRTKKQ